MLSILKTAIITIVISFISGVLLDAYKNLAPKILCSVSRAMLIKKQDKKIKVYVVTIKNLSKKTIHNLGVNIQGIYDDFQIDHRKTKGLKYELSNEENNYNVNIPFLSKNEEFCAKLLVENNINFNSEPLVTLRSPENFKEVRKMSRGNKTSVLDKISENTNGNNKKKKLFINKKAIIAVAALFLVVYIGVTVFEKYADKPAQNINVSLQNQNNKNKQNDSGKNVINKAKSNLKIKSSDNNKNSTAKTTLENNNGINKNVGSSEDKNNNAKEKSAATIGSNDQKASNSDSNAQSPQNSGTLPDNSQGNGNGNSGGDFQEKEEPESETAPQNNNSGTDTGQ